MENKIVNKGFVQPWIEVEEYVLGSNSKLPDEILIPNGDWSKYFTDNEKQANEYFDTY